MPESPVPYPEDDVIFEPLHFRNLSLKNRILRSNISGRFDNYDGSGNPMRVNWELKFARGGVGAIVSSFVPVTMQGRIVPNFATIDRDERIPFWREIGRRVHQYDCRYIMQLSHGGRQRDILSFDQPSSISSTDEMESVHGLGARRMTVGEIQKVVKAFGEGARRAREAGLDGVELHSANGYLFTQFLSSAINDRDDEYGGPLENRARFILEVVRAIRAEVGDDFHLQAKLSATEFNNAFFPWEAKGNSVGDTIRVCKWLEEAGVDAIHVSSGSMFPHPRNPAGDFPTEVAASVYGVMFASGKHTLRNYLIFRSKILGALWRWWWVRARGEKIEGISLDDSRLIKQAVNIPVICTGGFQTASVIRAAINRGDCDAVSIARPLIANNDLVHMFAKGLDKAPRPCTYCNKCLLNVLVHPLGCYEEQRYDSKDEMIAQILSVFESPPEEDTAPVTN
ncbi:MAG TPA: NADH:flavin oxidoreductase [Actinomycetota bacterium]|nr:NADH:flavin oxidoreductase [Actinomycetota bacterium]